MYSRQQASQLRQEFWTVFGHYMRPVLSAEGEKINWINYKTGEKDIFFKLFADNKRAEIGIELHHKDTDMQQLYFEQFAALKTLLRSAVHEDWIWKPGITDETGKVISKIYTEEKQVSVFKKEDWPILISFFKLRIIGLDEFWSNVKYCFEALR
jgi:hypothetical protein